MENCSCVYIYSNQNKNLIDSVTLLNNLFSELIIINFFSTDESVKEIEKFIKKQKNLIYHFLALNKKQIINISLKNTTNNKVIIVESKYSYPIEIYQKAIYQKKNTKKGITIVDKKRKENIKRLTKLFLKKEIFQIVF